MKKHCLKVWGDFACFTRPEMKVERVSYDVMTPSSARAVFEAILWKPAIRWHISRIHILNPIKWTNLRRNEVKSKASKIAGPIFIEDAEERVQRAGLFLKDVAYVIEGYFDVLSNHTDVNTEAKFNEMFERRARNGQCIMQPYLGCREFSAHFELLSEDQHCQPINESRDLGWMLYDLEYTNEEIRPMFFNPKLKNGVIEIPHFTSDEVKK